MQYIEYQNSATSSEWCCETGGEGSRVGIIETKMRPPLLALLLGLGAWSWESVDGKHNAGEVLFLAGTAVPWGGELCLVPQVCQAWMRTQRLFFHSSFMLE